MMHWPLSPWLEAERAISWTRVAFPEGEAIGLLWDDPLQGLLRSDSCDPLSRASCSRVIGMKDPNDPSISNMPVQEAIVLHLKSTSI